jgi:hypothetical protein
MTPITCIGKDNVSRIFWYEAERDQLEAAETWHFEVHLNNPSNRAADDVFLMTFKALGSASFLVFTATNNGRAWYLAKGISDALIPEAARALGKAITSSSNVAAAKRYDAEARNVAGQQVWDRFVAAGAAVFCAASDRYVFIGFPPAPAENV